RQLAIVDMQGRAVNRNPTQAKAASNYWGGMTGRYYACQGNTLAGRGVIVAMAQAYEDTAGSLADRLMAALLAGDLAGGDHRGRLAAGIRVAKVGVEGDWLRLQIDNSDDATRELVERYARLDHPAKGGWSPGREAAAPRAESSSAEATSSPVAQARSATARPQPANDCPARRWLLRRR
ncbi:MAG TPA: DUF1028 domain-containing protein, partial [Pirellulales bacterium]|nr:DUF1028 domain-containing protein [Pirellulales bacterium]